ncbi:hypothetical protein [Actimicrobium sp. CCI2.3]|nr:hypothetical protein [Actimicrobium sp. CCI2.3]MDY7574517.1 hypothetical protein [Actimicrobium sp. CCI2.3]MEB0024085.1 hypothetical protein [Actimicrobium sp. CCI2.3]
MMISIALRPSGQRHLRRALSHQLDIVRLYLSLLTPDRHRQVVCNILKRD